jgi:hypothetical protein
MSSLDEHQYKEYENFLSAGIHFETCTSNYDVRRILRQLLSSCEDGSFSYLIKWDEELFSCCELSIRERKEKGFLFPEVVFANGLCLPDIKSFESERIAFYKNRLENTKLFILRYRYLNYLIEYSPAKDRYLYAKLLCQEILMYLFNQALSFDFRDKFERLIEIALSYNIKEFIEKTKSLLDEKISAAIIDEQSILSQDDKTSWGLLSISQSLWHFKNKLELFVSLSTKAMLISKLNICKENSEPHSKEPFLHELIAWAQVGAGDVRNIAKELGAHHEFLAESRDVPLGKIMHYESALKVYMDYGISDEIAAVKVKLKDAHRNLAENGLHKHSFSVELPTPYVEYMDRAFRAYTEDVTPSNISDYVMRLSSKIFMPEKCEVDAKSEPDNKNSFLHLTSLAVTSNGRSVYNGSSSDDWEEFDKMQRYGISLDLKFRLFRRIWNVFLDAGMDTESISHHICLRDFISEDQKEIIKCGIGRLLAEDYISALHILVPQFEGAFRRFFEHYGFPTTSVASDGTQKEQTFTEFIKNDFVKIMPEDFIYMINYTMVNQLGLNLRNEVAHGLIELRSINQKIAHIVLYLLLFLFGLELKEKSEDA